MGKNYLKISILLLSVLLLMQMLSIACFAQNDPTEPVEWEYLDEHQIILGNNTTYYHYPSDSMFGIYMQATGIYEYSNTVYYQGQYNVYAPYPNADLIWIRRTSYSDPIFFVTENGKTVLDAFIAGKADHYRLRVSQSHVADMPMDAVDEMEAFGQEFNGSKVEVDVTKLRTAECYEITAHDPTDTLYYTHGAIYHGLGDGCYYYLNYQTLDNSHFDADGNFSYRSGTVMLTRLDASFQTGIEDLLKRGYSIRTEYTYEEDQTVSNRENEGIGWASIIVFGFLAPIPFLIIGLTLPHSQKRGYPKYWLILACTAGLWLLFSLLFAFLFAFA